MRTWVRSIVAKSGPAVAVAARVRRMADFILKRYVWRESQSVLKKISWIKKKRQKNDGESEIPVCATLDLPKYV